MYGKRVRIHRKDPREFGDDQKTGIVVGVINEEGLPIDEYHYVSLDENTSQWVVVSVSELEVIG